MSSQLQSTSKYWELSEPTERELCGRIEQFREEERPLWNRLIKAAIKLISSPSRSKIKNLGWVLDAGCATLPYVHQFRDFEGVVGVDISISHMAHNLMQVQYLEERRSNSKWRRQLHIPDANWPNKMSFLFELTALEHMIAALEMKYSLIFCNFVLSYPSSEDLTIILKQMYGVLEDGGLMLVKENLAQD